MISRVNFELPTRVPASASPFNRCKRNEQEALLAEIAKALSPYCDGDEQTALSLAEQTPAVAAIKTQRAQCYPSLYDVDADPVDTIDEKINEVLLAGKCEEVGVLFGSLAWKLFKKHPAIKARGLPLKWESNPALFTADASYMGCFTVVDKSDEGLAPDMDFLLKDEILIFGRHPTPNRRDPSFMKTLRLAEAVEKSRVVRTEDGRSVQVMLDWSAEIKVTNSAAIKRLNFNSP